VKTSKDQNLLNRFGQTLLSHQFESSDDFVENLVVTRFKAKLERPDPSRVRLRRESAWARWKERDSSLLENEVKIKGPYWARARLLIHRALRGFKLGSLSFTNGSEFNSTSGFGSIESKLRRSRWTCTPDNFSAWFDLCWSNLCLKYAVRKRFAQLLAKQDINKRHFERFLWQKYRNFPDFPKKIFEIKLLMVTEMVHGNRFSTVPKNNLKDRPICIEPLANILVQRTIGLGIRRVISNYFGIDLNTSADLHRRLISDDKFATIDLKDASDSISTSLCKYLFPRWFFDLLENSRSQMTLGIDDDFYLINKISSMGNGFTFELMSLILLSLGRSISVDSYAFGDDLIIPNDYSDTLVSALQIGQFEVNMEKTHIHSNYRESCGAHYYDGYGYITSFDVKYPKSIHDIIVTLNKLGWLSRDFQSFRSLFKEAYAIVPTALRVDNPVQGYAGDGKTARPLVSYLVDGYLRFGLTSAELKFTPKAKRRLKIFGKRLFIDIRGAQMHLGYEWKPSGSSPDHLVPQKHWAKIFMYLSSSRICKDERRGSGTFKSYPVITFKNGTTFRWSDIVIASQ